MLALVTALQHRANVSSLGRATVRTLRLDELGACNLARLACRYCCGTGVSAPEVLVLSEKWLLPRERMMAPLPSTYQP